MGKRRRRKVSSTLTWKATKGFFHLVSKGIIKSTPLWVLAGVGFLVFWGIRKNLYADPGFLIQTLVVKPDKALTVERLSELEKTYLSRNLFTVSPKEVAEAVESDPKIRQARVIREFPNTLRIEIADRDPFAEVQLAPNGPFYVVAEDGVILEKQSERHKDLVLFEAHEWASRRAEKGKEIPIAGFREAVHFTRAFWQHPLSRTERIDRIRLDHLGGVNLGLVNGPELRFGPQPMKRLATLNSLTPLLQGKDRNQILYINLQFQDIIVRKK